MTPRVAILCSGLGHVQRGNETWAATVAEGLHKSGGNVILIGSGRRPEARSPYLRVPCVRREGFIRRFVSWDKGYLYEQVSFAMNVRKHLRGDRFDIVHTADPNVAQQLISHLAREKIELIYQDSLFIGPKWCSKFSHVQVLAPVYWERAAAEKVDVSGWRAIPQTVDTKRFAPGSAPATPTVLSVGDFSATGKKRLDWIIDECAAARSAPKLLLVGNAAEGEREPIEARCREKLKGRFEIRTGVPHEQMPAVYRDATIYVHAAVREPFGLVLIEAMASGLPVLGHKFEVTQWIVGEGGRILEMTTPGELAKEIDAVLLNVQTRNELSAKARERARSVFDQEVILPMYHQWYNELAQRRLR